MAFGFVNVLDSNSFWFLGARCVYYWNYSIPCCWNQEGMSFFFPNFLHILMSSGFQEQ